MSCKINKAFSQDSILVFLKGFVPIPVEPVGPEPCAGGYPEPITMPHDERRRNFPQIITFAVETVSEIPEP